METMPIVNPNNEQPITAAADRQQLELINIMIYPFCEEEGRVRIPSVLPPLQ